MLGDDDVVIKLVLVAGERDGITAVGIRHH